MKKLFLVCLAALVPLFGVRVMGDKTHVSVVKCEINGVLEEDNMASVAFLIKDAGGKPQILDSAKVSGGKFHLTAELEDLPCVRFIGLKGLRTDYITVFLDADKLDVVQDKKTHIIKVAGSETNESYSQMMEQLGEQQKRLKSMREARKDNTLSEEARKELEESMEDIYKRMDAVQKKYLDENATNIMGLALLHEMYSDMDGGMVESYLQKIPAAYREDSWYKRIAEYVEAEKKTAEGNEYPDVELQTPDGKTKKISDFVEEGKFTIIDFWASWCAPCRAEMPNLVRIYKEFGDKGISILGISLDNHSAAWKKGIKDLGITWGQLSDLKGWRSKAAEEYGVRSIPKTIVVAPNGRIVKKGLRGKELYEACKEWAK